MTQTLPLTKSDLSAHELFKAQGWSIAYNSYDYDQEIGELCYESDVFPERIYFYADGRYIEVDTSVQIEVSLFLAMQKQMKELGWL